MIFNEDGEVLQEDLRSGEDRSGEDRSGEDRSCEDRSGKDEDRFISDYSCLISSDSENENVQFQTFDRSDQFFDPFEKAQK